MMNAATPRVRSVVFVLAALSGCGDTTLEPVRYATDAALAPEDAEPSCEDMPPISCDCDDGRIGAQYCVRGSYGPCGNCVARVDAGVGVARCEAGRYIGRGIGTHMSSAAGIPYLTKGGATKSDAAWSFSLAQRGGEEFYAVGNACVHIFEAGGVDDGYNRLQLSGDVDCATGQLIGVIRGYYTAPSIFSPLEAQRFYYKGELTGTFDPVSKSFVDGTWTIREPAVLLSDPPSGSGTWAAALDDDAGVPEPEPNCLGAEFPESAF